MAEKICNLLKLDTQAGLGRRLVASEIEPDPLNPDSYRILPKDDVVETSKLAYALSIWARDIVHLDHINFKPGRTLAG
jgi:hypothetical protein